MGSFSQVSKARRPEWQDVIPKDKEQRETYAIAAKHVNRFARAYMDTTRALNDGINRRDLEDAIESMSPTRVNAVLGFYNPGVVDPTSPWKKMVERFKVVNGDLVLEAGNAALARDGIILKSEHAGFTLDNPFSEKWINEHAGEMIQGVSDQTRKGVQRVLDFGFNEGVPPKTMSRLISFGMNERETIAVISAMEELIESGAKLSTALKVTDKLKDKFTRQRAMRIARTETIAAEAQGTLHSWGVAKERGLIGNDAKKEWIASGLSARTCVICLSLDGVIVPVSENFDVGVDAPPAHVMCRCTMALIP